MNGYQFSVVGRQNQDLQDSRIRGILNENCPYKKLTLLQKLFVLSTIVSDYKKNENFDFFHKIC